MTQLPMLQTECLSDELLKSYLAGYLPEDSATQVEQHLSQCTECEDLMRKIDSNAGCDELLRPVQTHAHPIDPDEAPVVPDRAVAPERSNVPSHPMLPWLTSREIGPYELIEPLGHGGMGLVYLARHRKLDRLVAIKLLPAHHQTAEARLRFEREILAAGRLQHPAVVSATDAGQFGDMDYLVMEYVRGLDLGRLSKSIPVLNIEETCEIGRQIAIGLSYAHAQGFVHRDIKPSNVILDDGGVVKILDFGLVLFDRWDGVSNELTTVGQFLGTLDYMAPEQAERCGSVDFRADLYALGATLFKLLCGRAPLAAAPNQSPIDKLRLLANHRPPSLRTLRSDAPDALIRLVDTLLSTTPQARPASAAHVAQDLQPLAKPGCLVDLIARARSLEAETKKPTASLVELKMKARLSSDFPISTQPALDRDRNGNRRWLWIAVAMIPFAFLAGYIIQLDTPDGQFIVESEVAGAQVRIVKAGAEIKSFKIETGNSVTKLSAGKYEVTLDSPSDGVSIDRDTFVIERGAVVIARIRRASAISIATTETSVPPPSTTSKTNSTEAIFDGKPLSEWLEIARREKQLKSWLVAMNALNVLLDGAQKKELFEEIFQLCLSRQDFSLANKWDLFIPFAERIVKEMENSDSTTRLQLAAMICGPFFESSLDPIWKWLERKAEQDPGEAEQIARVVMGLPKAEASLYGIDLRNTVYVVKHFPRLASLFDTYLIDHWQEGPYGQTNSDAGPRNSLFLHVQGLAMKRLETFDKGFADHVAALSIILMRDNKEIGGFSGMSPPQKELVCQRTVELISIAWENRETPYVAVWNGRDSSRLNWSTRSPEGPDLSVPRLLSVIEDFFDWVRPDVATRDKILSALAILEENSRELATEATTELPTDLTGLTLSEATFRANDFRLEDKSILRQGTPQEIVVYPLPATLSAERRAKADAWCFAYNVHRIVSTLIWRQTPAKLSPPAKLTPIEIGERLSAFRTADLNGDWSLSQNEWLPLRDARLGPILGPINIAKFSEMTEELDSKLRNSNALFSKLDKDNDNRLSPNEAMGSKDFAILDRDSDGFLDAFEYSLRGAENVGASIANSKDVEMRAWYQTRFGKEDKDGNGLLTLDEAPANFAAFDLDKDGLISLDEYIAARSRK